MRRNSRGCRTTKRTLGNHRSVCFFPLISQYLKSSCNTRFMQAFSELHKKKIFLKRLPPPYSNHDKFFQIATQCSCSYFTLSKFFKSSCPIKCLQAISALHFGRAIGIILLTTAKIILPKCNTQQ